jgi:uncharacterized protein (TIGR00251 family)
MKKSPLSDESGMLGPSVSINVKVIPRAKRDEIVGIENDWVKIRLKAPPVEGKANEALVGFLAKRLGVPKAKVVIVRGETARSKVIRVEGLDERAVMDKMGL